MEPKVFFSKKLRLIWSRCRSSKATKAKCLPKANRGDNTPANSPFLSEKENMHELKSDNSWAHCLLSPKQHDMGNILEKEVSTEKDHSVYNNYRYRQHESMMKVQTGQLLDQERWPCDLDTEVGTPKNTCAGQSQNRIPFWTRGSWHHPSENPQTSEKDLYPQFCLRIAQD